jgi:hypothetical protein
VSAAVPGGNARGFLQVERDLPRGGGGWRTDGEPEAHKDRLDPLGLGDRRGVAVVPGVSSTLNVGAVPESERVRGGRLCVEKLSVLGRW